ncbi:uncharacterized protein N7459_007420 [Penicillium hispanicum]|uniref:uncharacterized protein n=1 Tax=Penicillium hispanicum TaxID=1080232 RepID=UPI00253F9833|nr:uncharacterized protein N7459_007420 [Penicillium hispanicum]KAJ5578456.1 hypothetical protein N7459_007420 [Penicillium hispanicum]
MKARLKTLGTPEPGNSKAYGRKSRPTKSEVDALKSQVTCLKSQLEESQRTIARLQQAQLTIPAEAVASPTFIDPQFVINGNARHQPAQELGFDMGFESLFGFLDETIDPDAKAHVPSPSLSQPDPIEALSSVVAKLHLDDITGEPYYLGPTSNLHFLGQAPRSSVSSEATSLPSTFSPGSEVFALPPPVPASHLARLFEIKAQPYFPLINKLSIDSFDAIPMSSSLTFLYDQVLALAAWCLDENDVYYGYRDSCIEFYNHRFAESLNREIQHVCLTNAQAFLLKSYITTLNGECETSTVFLAIACAMVKRLGLHVDPLVHDPHGVALRQGTFAERAATFWACFKLDRQLALLEGRACYMPACDIPSCRPFETLVTNLPIVADVNLSLELINACHIEFLYLQDEVLREIYSFTTSIPQDRVISEGHVRYMSWYQSLPPCIRDMKNGRSYHPTFLSFHMAFYNGVILLHRPYLRKGGFERDMANQQCRDSAFQITTILKTLTQQFGYSISDFMVVHSALSAGLVHLVALRSPDAFVYRRSVRALKSIVNILAQMIPHVGYAKVAFDDLRRLSVKWSLSPANSPAFWPTFSSDAS